MSGLRWNDSIGGKKRKREGATTKNSEGQNGNESDDNSPPGGSFPLEEIKLSEEFKRKVTFPKDAPKRKYALCVSYLGTAYRGLQINPGIMTVEAVLEKALYLAGGIEDCNFGDFYKLSWSRAGRTDKGVHAVTNCCSMKLSLPLDTEAVFVESVNTFLPEDVRVLAMTKTMKTFSAKVYCSGRLYRYMLPTYVLSQVAEATAVMENVLAQGTEEALIADEKTGNKHGTISSMTPDQLASTRAALMGHRLTPGALVLFREILQKYEGTHKFHNFTSDKNPSDDNAKRYIISVECSEPMLFPESPVEWVCISLRGQSFLLNQIRKMIGLAISVFRGAKPMDVFDRCFLPTEKVDILMVPGLGLYLKELFFERYHVKLELENEKNVATKKKLLAKHKPVNEVPAPFERIEWASTVSDAIASFENNTVWPHVCSEEASSLRFSIYLDALRVRALNAKSAIDNIEAASLVTPPVDNSNSAVSSSSSIDISSTMPAAAVVISETQTKKQQQQRQHQGE